MDYLLESIRFIHIAAGFIGLAAFWVPVFTRKGGKQHRLFGKIFKYCAYFVLGAAFFSITIRMISGLATGDGPAAHPQAWGFLVFLGYLTVVTFIILRHGLTVLTHKDMSELRRPLDLGLANLAIAASVVVVGYAVLMGPPNKILLYALSPIGILSGLGIRKAVTQEPDGKRTWFYEHLNAMLGAGIAFHTAFAVFGVNQLFSFELPGWTAVLPWIMPALIGVPATAIWMRHYRRKFEAKPG